MIVKTDNREPFTSAKANNHQAPQVQESQRILCRCYWDNPRFFASLTCTITMKFALSTFLLLQASAGVASTEVLKLTDADFLEKTNNRAIFIKFFAPWCDVCQEMAPEFEKLAADWEKHDIGLVAEVDCADPQSEPICDDYDVENFPTLYFGDPQSPEEYEGALTYEAMAEFAKEHISKPPCSVKNPGHCDEEHQTMIRELVEKTTEELQDVEEEVQERLGMAQNEYDEEIEALNERYEHTVRVFNDQVDEIRGETNYKWVQQVLLKREQDAAKEL